MKLIDIFYRVSFNFNFSFHLYFDFDDPNIAIEFARRAYYSFNKDQSDYNINIEVILLSKNKQEETK